MHIETSSEAGVRNDARMGDARTAVRIGSWVSALAILLASLTGAGVARAQLAEADQAACGVFEAFFEGGLAFCDEVGGCEPTERDCLNLCRNGATTCRQASLAVLKAVSDTERGIQREARILCRGTLDPRGCFRTVGQLARELKMGLRFARIEILNACRNEFLFAECIFECNRADVAAPCMCSDIGALSCSSE